MNWIKTELKKQKEFSTYLNFVALILNSNLIKNRNNAIILAIGGAKNREKKKKAQ